MTRFRCALIGTVLLVSTIVVVHGQGPYTSQIQLAINQLLAGAFGPFTGGIVSTALASLTTPAESWIGPSTTTGIYFKGGNIGIGTTTPGASVDVTSSGGIVVNSAYQSRDSGGTIRTMFRYLNDVVVFTNNALGLGPAQFNFLNGDGGTGVGIDAATAGTLKVRTTAQNAYATVDAGSYKYSGNTLSGTTGSIGGGALIAGACTSGTVAITGSTTTMTATASPNTYPGDGSAWDAYVSTNGTVTVKVCAIVALTPSAGSYNVRVQP